LASSVDVISINVFPWWENRFSGLFPCTAATEATDFHVARMQDVIARYPGRRVVLSEYGWPAGPQGYSETNTRTGQHCGVASEDNQELVRAKTTERLEQLGLEGVFFESEREPWKEREGLVGPYWGLKPVVVPPKTPTGFHIVKTTVP